jgi:hypothetical protein
LEIGHFMLDQKALFLQITKTLAFLSRSKRVSTCLFIRFLLREWVINEWISRFRRIRGPTPLGFMSRDSIENPIFAQWMLIELFSWDGRDDLDAIDDVDAPVIVVDVGLRRHRQSFLESDDALDRVGQADLLFFRDIGIHVFQQRRRVMEHISVGWR